MKRIKLKFQKDLIYQIALLQVKGIGPSILRKMLLQFESAENIMLADKADFIEKNLYHPKLYNKIKESKTLIDYAVKELDFCNRNNIHVISYNDPEFPYRLKECNDAPQILFCKGKESLNKKRILSIVGTRRPSPYGLQICKALCEALSYYDTTIVSGLAHGIDYNAHCFAMKNQLPTFAVLGHGHKHIYPSNHVNTANEIMNNGLLVSEYCSMVKPSKYTFPKRNRIIAGISDATLVVESPLKGGSMITARIANSYNKDVFAIPGNIFSEKSAGCNHLIKNNEAHLIDSANELVRMMDWEKENVAIKNKFKNFNKLTEDEMKIISFLQKSGRSTIDEICSELHETINELHFRLTQLEIKGIIQQHPGKIFHYIG